MNNSIQLLDVVALTEDLPRQKLHRGQVGTVVEILAPNVFEVEFKVVLGDETLHYSNSVVKTGFVGWGGVSG